MTPDDRTLDASRVLGPSGASHLPSSGDPSDDLRRDGIAEKVQNRARPRDRALADQVTTRAAVGRGSTSRKKRRPTAIDHAAITTSYNSNVHDNGSGSTVARTSGSECCASSRTQASTRATARSPRRTDPRARKQNPVLATRAHRRQRDHFEHRDERQRDGSISNQPRAQAS